MKTTIALFLAAVWLTIFAVMHRQHQELMLSLHKISLNNTIISVNNAAIRENNRGLREARKDFLPFTLCTGAFCPVEPPARRSEFVGSLCSDPAPGRISCEDSGPISGVFIDCAR